jgi:hypothetical protein
MLRPLILRATAASFFGAAAFFCQGMSLFVQT